MIPRNPWDIKLEEGVMLDRHVVLLSTGEPVETPRIRIDYSVYINRFTVIDAAERVEVGPHTMIGPHCYITDHDHGVEPNASVGSQPLRSAEVSIGQDVWVGAGVAILKGTSIGNKAVIGAGAVVTDDVSEGAKVAGVPGRRIGWRVENSSIRK